MSVYKEFAQEYVHDFMEMMVLGCTGGLYGHVISIEEGKEGIFTDRDMKKFVSFQHGGNDYHYAYSDSDDHKLINNHKKLAKALLKLVDTDWYGKDHYTEVAPNLVNNTKQSLNTIIAS